MYKNLYLIVWLTILLNACGTDSSQDNNRSIVELEQENKRISEQLNKANAFISELNNKDGTIFKPQVITRAAQFTDDSDTLQTVRDRKRLICGGNADLPGFGYLDPGNSRFLGFDIDICRAVGAAVLGPEGADLVEVIGLPSKRRFTTLQTGGIDVLVRNTTWTMSRDTELRVDFAGVTFYDGQGVLVRNKDEILKLSDLAGRAICVQAGSTSLDNIQDYFNNAGLKVEVRAFEDRIVALKQYESKACDAYTADKSSLTAQRTLLATPKAHNILVEEVSREPLGPVVRHNDAVWRDIIFWTMQCLVNAEALGINQKNVLEQQESSSLPVKRLLGIEGELGSKLGITNDFCFQVIRQVGSYKDIYDRHLGVKSDFFLARGLNALYFDGGLLYPLPFK